MQDPLTQVADYYSDKVATFGPTAKGVDWRDEASQQLRFSELLKITRGERSGSIADVGCGWGGFAVWLQQHALPFDYTGYDVSELMLRHAREQCGQIPSARFFQRSSAFEPADWVIASGIFNVRFDAGDHDWRQHMDATIDEMARAARKGFAFNCLTGFSDADRKEPRLYYPYPGEVLDAMMRRYGRFAALSHDTSLYEFTVLIWKP